MNARPANEPDPRGRSGLLPGPYDARSARDPQRSTRSRLMPVRRELHPIRPAQPHPQPLVGAPAQARSRTLQNKPPENAHRFTENKLATAPGRPQRSLSPPPRPTEPRRPQSQRAADPYPIWHPARVSGPPCRYGGAPATRLPHLLSHPPDPAELAPLTVQIAYSLRPALLTHPLAIGAPFTFAPVRQCRPCIPWTAAVCEAAAGANLHIRT